MKPFSLILKRLGVLTAFFAVAGCASAPDYFIAEGAAGASGHETIALFPLNFDRELPEYLLDSTDLLQETVVDYLGEHGKDVSRVSFSSARAYWSAAVSQAREQRGESTATPETLATARGLIAKKLASEQGADAVIFQNVLERAAKYSGNAAKWDGVKRRQTVEWNGPKSWGETNQTMRGYTPALSLQVRVNGANGSEVFSRFAGLELRQLLRVEGFKYWMEDRTDLLTDATVIRESVVLAFDPYLTAPVE